MGVAMKPPLETPAAPMNRVLNTTLGRFRTYSRHAWRAAAARHQSATVHRQGRVIKIAASFMSPSDRF